MENRLKKLFDYQRFEKNKKLEELIRETESRDAVELSDDSLAFVNAAGGTDTAGGNGTESDIGQSQQETRLKELN